VPCNSSLPSAPLYVTNTPGELRTPGCVLSYSSQDTLPQIHRACKLCHKPPQGHSAEVPKKAAIS